MKQVWHSQRVLFALGEKAPFSILSAVSWSISIRKNKKKKKIQLCDKWDNLKKIIANKQSILEY